MQFRMHYDYCGVFVFADCLEDLVPGDVIEDAGFRIFAEVPRLGDVASGGCYVL